ncbi:MAG: hypothetical protein ACREP7_01150 [Lysobacter sp.]
MGETSSEVLATASGLAAQQLPLAKSPTLVAPTDSNGTNRFRILVAPIACWRVDDLCFEFDASFPGPRLQPGLVRLAQLLALHPPASQAARLQPPEALGCPLSVFAHADPVGSDDYNKQLSGRRAAAVYALLTHDTSLWERLYAQPLGDDRWGRPALQAMLQAVGAGPDEDVEALERDAAQRQALYARYMSRLWPSPHTLEKSDFLGRGADPHGKGDYQGCGEFNPMMLASQQEEDEFAQSEDHTLRNRINAPNRRVMVLIFRRGSRVDPDLWPCPRVTEGPAACRKRFWNDGEARRSRRLPDQRRYYDQDKDSFACRFYDRLVGRSPCERLVKTVAIRLYDLESRAIAHAPYRLEIEGREPTIGVADSEGILTLRDVEVPATCLIRWALPASEQSDSAQPASASPASAQTPPDYVFGLSMFLSADDPDSEVEARKKLNNLGYIDPDPAINTCLFQRDYRQLAKPPLVETGRLDPDTLRVLREVYARCEDDLRRTQMDASASHP